MVRGECFLVVVVVVVVFRMEWICGCVGSVFSLLLFFGWSGSVVRGECFLVVVAVLSFLSFSLLVCSSVPPDITVVVGLGVRKMFL